MPYSERPPPLPDDLEAPPKEPTLWMRVTGEILPMRASWLRFPLALFLFTRIALFALSSLSLGLAPAVVSSADSTPVVSRFRAFEGLCRLECSRYHAAILRGGEAQASDSAVWPLYPAIAGGLTRVTGWAPEFTLLLLANLFCLGAYLVIYRVFADLEDENSARVGLGLFAAYPFAYYHGAGYPEPMVAFFGALAVLLVVRGRNWWGGVAASAAALTNPLGLTSWASLLAATVRQGGLDPRRLLVRAGIVSLLLPFAALGAYAFYVHRKLGLSSAFWPSWKPFEEWARAPGIASAMADPRLGAAAVVALVPAMGTVALATRRKWAELAACTVPLIAIAATVGAGALDRVSSWCWPAFLPLGLWLSKRPNLREPVAISLAVAQGVFFFLFTHRA